MFVQIIIIVVGVAAAAIVAVYNNNNNNFPICYPGCLLTRLHHSKIYKEDHGPSIFTCQSIQSMLIRIEDFPTATKWENLPVAYLCLPTVV